MHADHDAGESEHTTASSTRSHLQPGLDHGKPVVGMKNVNVSYDTRKATTSSFIILMSLTRSLGAQHINLTIAKVSVGIFKAQMVRKHCGQMGA